MTASGVASGVFGVADRLRGLLGGGVAAPTGELEACHSALEEDVLALVHDGDHASIGAYWGELRHLYESVAAVAPDGYETAVAYHLGRLACLVEVLGRAAELVPPARVVDAVAGDGGRQLLVMVHEAEWASDVDLAARLGWDLDVTSRRLARLGELGLVLVRRRGDLSVAQVTPLGGQALHDVPG